MFEILNLAYSGKPSSCISLSISSGHVKSQIRVIDMEPSVREVDVKGWLRPANVGFQSKIENKINKDWYMLVKD